MDTLSLYDLLRINNQDKDYLENISSFAMVSSDAKISVAVTRGMYHIKYILFVITDQVQFLRDMLAHDDMRSCISVILLLITDNVNKTS